MPTWGQLVQELSRLQQSWNPAVHSGTSPHDFLRRKYLKQLSDKTGRATIVYATAWLQDRPNVSAQALSIGLIDVQGFMEAVSNVKERELDLILHSPGGSAEAAEAVIDYLRTRFDHIRAIVPIAAMSAATMMALACDEIMMGDHSQLGPIDPQFTIPTPEGPRSAPGQAIIDQFNQAKAECQDPKNIGAWMPLLRSLAPGLIAQCGHQRVLAEDFVAKHLETHMFKGQPEPAKKAADVAAWFSDFNEFRSHGRRVDRAAAESRGLTIVDMADDDDLQDAILSVHHAVTHTFAGTPATKIIENHKGRAFIEMTGQVQLVQASPTNPTGQPIGTTGAPMDRAARRRQERAQGKK